MQDSATIQKIIEMFYIDGYTIDGISRLLDIPPEEIQVILDANKGNFFQ